MTQCCRNVVIRNTTTQCWQTQTSHHRYRRIVITTWTKFDSTLRSSALSVDYKRLKSQSSEHRAADECHLWTPTFIVWPKLLHNRNHSMYGIINCLVAHQISLGDWVIEYVIFLHGLASNGSHERNEVWHKGSLRDEDDTQTSSTCIAQRKRVIPHLTLKNNRNMMCILVTTLYNQPVCFSDSAL